MEFVDYNGNDITNIIVQPNDNLLINSDFKSGIINQRGQTVYDPVNKWTLSIDGWIYFGQMQVYVQENQIRLYALSSNTETSYFKQMKSNIKNGKYIAYIHVVSLSGSARVTFVNGANISLQVGDNFIETDVTGNFEQFQIHLDGKGVNLIIDQMELDPGDQFTGMPVWNEAVELYNCLEEYQTGLFGELDPYFQSETTSRFELIVKLQRPMKKVPGIVKYDNLRVGKENITPSSISVKYMTLSTVAIEVVTSRNYTLTNASIIGLELNAYD